MNPFPWPAEPFPPPCLCCSTPALTTPLTQPSGFLTSPEHTEGFALLLFFCLELFPTSSNNYLFLITQVSEQTSLLLRNLSQQPFPEETTLITLSNLGLHIHLFVTCLCHQDRSSMSVWFTAISVLHKIMPVSC